MKSSLSTKLLILITSLIFFLRLFVASAQPIAGEFYITQVSPNGQMLAGVTTAGLIRIWDTQSGATLFDLDNSGTPLPLSVAWAPDSNRIATAGGDATIRVWCTDISPAPQCTQGQLLHEMTGHEDPITAIAWSSDNWLASGGQIETWTVRIWDMSTYQEIGHSQLGLVRQLTWSPNGDYLAKVNDGYEVFVVDSPLTRPIDYLASRINDFSILAYSVAWSDDSTKIAYGTIDGEIHIVEIVDSTTRNEIKVLQGHVGKIYALTWNSDNIQLASSAEDGTTRIWNTLTGASTVFQSPKTIAVNLQISWSIDGSTLYYPIGGSNLAGLPTLTPSVTLTPTQPHP